MDLGAYVQIEDLEHLLKENNIEIPRLRGIRLMEREETVSEYELNEEAHWIGLEECESLCESNFSMNACCFELSYRTDRIKHKYLLFDDKHNVTGVNWKSVHGYRRKLFKYEFRKALERVKAQYAVFNRYCGQPNILYVHSRIGGNNWNYYGGPDLKTKDWFLEKVDDAFDSTYCDIYVKIGENDV